MRFSRAMRRRFGIAAAPVAIRHHYPWYWRMLFWLALIAVSLYFVRWVYDSGMQLAGFARGETGEELAKLRKAVAQLETENRTLRSTANVNARQVEIDQVAQGDLNKTVRTLQEENSRLKEDIAFLQSQMSSGKGEGQIEIQRMKVEKGLLPGEYRYTLMAVQSGKRDREFRGHVQFLINVVQDGKKSVLLHPAAAERDSASYKLGFRYYQRVEGGFQVPPSAVVKSVQARIFEPGAAQPKLMQAVNLP